MAKGAFYNSVPQFLTMKLKAAQKGHMRFDRCTVRDVQLFHLALDEFLKERAKTLPTEISSACKRLKGLLKDYLVSVDASTLTENGNVLSEDIAEARAWLEERELAFTATHQTSGKAKIALAIPPVFADAAAA
jgi:hypothetical protein